MPVTDCHRCGTMVHYDALLSEPRCTPCALAERDAALAVLAELLRVDTEPGVTHAAIVAARARARALLGGERRRGGDGWPK